MACRREAIAAWGGGLILCGLALAGAPALAGAGDWPMYNHDPAGTREGAADPALTRDTARTLHPAWTFRAPGGVVYGTPAVVDGTVYDADVLGFVFALDADSGAVKWLTHIPGTGLPFPFQVTDSPLVTERDVIVGDQGGTAYAFDRASGALHWLSKPNHTAYAALWGSPVEIEAHMPDDSRRKLIIVGVSSNEETFTPTALQPCCFARGSVAALDPDDGHVVWQTYTIGDADAARGAAGATVWATPTFDSQLNSVFVATGNNFGNSDSSPTTRTSDALMALDAGTGLPFWTNQRTADDAFTIAFHISSQHPDLDFGDSPEVMLLPGGRKVIAAGQKSGVLYVLDAQSGDLLGLQQFLPSGGYGGLFADSATANGIIYADGNNWPDFGGGEFGALLGSFVGGSDPVSGDVVAIRPDDSGQLHELWRLSTPASPMMAGVAVSNGVVYADASRQGILYALNSDTGEHLAEVHIGPSVSGPSVAHGKVFIGYGDIVNIGGTNPLVGGVMALAANAPAAAGGSSGGATATGGEAGSGGAGGGGAFSVAGLALGMLLALRRMRLGTRIRMRS